MGQHKSKAKKTSPTSLPPPEQAPAPPAPVPKAAHVEPIKPPQEPQAAQKTEEKIEPDFNTALMYTSRREMYVPPTPKPEYEGADNIVTAVSSYLAIAASQSRFRLSQPLPPPPKLQLLHDIPITAN